MDWIAHLVGDHGIQDLVSRGAALPGQQIAGVDHGAVGELDTDRLADHVQLVHDVKHPLSGDVVLNNEIDATDAFMNKDNSRNMQRQQAIAETPATATPPAVQPTITRMPACQQGRTEPPQTQAIAETPATAKPQAGQSKITRMPAPAKTNRTATDTGNSRDAGNSKTASRPTNNNKNASSSKNAQNCHRNRQ